MKYYCIGIKGTGMGTLACILHDLGNQVSGYDDSKEKKFTEEGLNKRNIKINYEATDLDEDTIITHSKAFKKDHPEIVRLKKLKYKFIEYNKLLGDVTKKFDSIGISGTHGKTTTSLLLTNIISESLGCNYFIGDGTGYANSNNDKFVFEADEFNKHFLAYHPTTAIITNIELDHVESYRGLNDLKNSFRKYANRAKRIIACGDDNNIRNINFNKKAIYYGFDLDNDFVARNLILGEDGCSFDVYYNGNYFDHYHLPFYGKHMILNALAAILTCVIYGIEKKEIKSSLKKFKGAKRRFKEEIIGNRIIIDDYAHHPTEISATLEAVKQKYSDKEIVAIFLPNTYSRTEAFKEEFINSLNKANKVYVMPIYSDRESQKDFPNVSSDLIINEIDGAEEITLASVEKLLKHDDVVYCFMSCTNIYLIVDKFKETLKKML